MTTLCRLTVEQRVKKPKLIMKKITKKKRRRTTRIVKTH